MDKIGYILLKGILTLLGLVPLKIRYGITRFFALRLGLLKLYRRSVVIVNFARCFPNLNYWDMDPQMYNAFYHHLSDLIAETIWFGGCRNAERLHRQHLVEIVNPEVLNEYYESSTSVMVLYSHCGNWELLGGIQEYNYSGKPFCVNEKNFRIVYRKLSSDVWDRLMRENRFAPLHDRKNFEGYIESKNLVRYALKHRDEKMIYNVNTDQRPYYAGSDNMRVTFMGQECHTMSAAASLACKCRMSVLYMSMTTEDTGHYKIEYIPICADASSRTPQDIMQRYYDLISEDIRRQPHNYLWTHRRWQRY